MTTRGTPEHVYFLDERLGVGSSASVYVGRNKKTGRLCAVKVFKNWNYAVKREVEAMQILKHENIVKFISIEPESHTKDNVLIMELCTGGSVLNMLEKPEYAYGFQEDEFLCFLKDITAALKYLRENKIVHRDIKPGNILKFVKDDLSPQYKLTDFGAARELGDDDVFASIYGTEEYLEPTAYEQALLRGKLRSGRFDASVDLWSLGVTLYHVATGQLPFQPYGGRRNKEEMFKITSMKKRRIISGIQKRPDGPIEWSEDLPSTCLLSRGLKRTLKRMLANLLECDIKLRWTFEDFFKYSTELTSLRLFHVLLVNELCLDRFYAGSEDLGSASHFSDFLKSQRSSFSSKSIHFYHPYLSVEELLQNSFPDALSYKPIFLYPYPYVDDFKSFIEEQVSAVEMPLVPDNKSLSSDYSFAYKSSAYIYFLIQKSEKMFQLCNHLEIFFYAVSKDLASEIEKVREINEAIRRLHLSKNLVPRGSQTDIFEIPDNFPNNSTKRISESLDCLLKDDETSLKTLQNEKMSYYELLLIHREKVTDKDINKFRKNYKESLEITEKFNIQANSTTTLTHNESQIHKFDRSRIAKLNNNSSVLYSAFGASVNSFLTSFMEWFRYYCRKRELLESKVKKFQDILEKIIDINNHSYNGSLVNPDNPVDPHLSKVDLKERMAEDFKKEVDIKETIDEEFKVFDAVGNEFIKKLHSLSSSKESISMLLQSK